MTVIHAGDVYCPRCGSERIVLDFTYDDTFWSCESCKHEWRFEHTGIDWEWPDGQKPNPGCPWCGTAHITLSAQRYGDAGTIVADGMDGYWSCLREVCGKRWRGSWTRFLSPDAPHRDRWKIRIPARDVPFRRTLDNPTTYPHLETS